ncbi:helix-turn-helix domain-containing protein [Allobranchiibius sp. GilTou38]|uniref:helix-turn-helix domain-containing protein n=1 Tax=Allobranchiibius sp. GilTou38 TaxID=2815210 RepID=UPI001AA0B6DA|nr:helix-turn-helix domain-containing protein [Allobranchiibius sp. GilTou38]MBO1767052.1 helix-turn-helix domain-containing protein [Allobranchiibius sp. GilTou38]
MDHHLLDTQSAADLLGISVRSIYRLSASGQLPQYRVGRQLRYDEAELRAVLKSRHARPTAV